MPRFENGIGCGPCSQKLHFQRGCGEEKEEGLMVSHKPFIFLVAGRGFEPLTFGL